MSSFRIFFFTALTFYSITLFYIEKHTSQDFVRNFLTDIEGPVFFYAINTSLSVFLLWSTALVFAICLLCIDSLKAPQEKLFYFSQIGLFAWLGFDDRFLVHEHLSHWVHEIYIMLGLALLEVYFLIGLGRLNQQPQSALFYLGMGAIFTGMMIVIDTFMPSHIMFRLSAEDLSKLWGTFFLFLFAWEILKYKIQQLKDQNQ
jgi:hypothetical protein